jgi:hypothetical protein
MNPRARTFYVLLILLLGAGATRAADLGAKVSYQKDTPVQFAAFSLTFIGQRRVVTPKFPPGMTSYDFRVTSPHGAQTVSWSSGTGDIGPTPFTVAGERFALELKRSDKLGKLKDGELVITRAP